MKYTPIIGLALMSVSCATETTPETIPEVQQEVALDGKALMEAQCFICHAPAGSDNRLAPPMSRVKDHYLTEGMTKQQFTDAMVQWVENPNEEDVQMPGAFKKFGLMPKQNFKSEEVRAIAEYLFDETSEDACCSHEH